MKKSILSLILCISCLFPIQVHANEISIQQDEETYNVVIECSDIDYLNKIEQIELNDGISSTYIDLQKDFNQDFYNCVINENTLTVFYSTLLKINQGSYKVTLKANGYDDVEVDYGLVFEKNTIDAPVDLQVNLIENGIEFKSKNYSFIHGLVLSYDASLNDYTYSYLQFSTLDTFESSVLFENISQDFPYSLIELNSDGSYSVMVYNEQLKKMGVEANLQYYMAIKSASFKEVVFGPMVLYTEKIQDDLNDNNDITDNDIVDDSNEEIDDSKDEIIDDEKTEDDQPVENEYDTSLDGYLLGLIFMSLCILGFIGYLIYIKKYKNH